MPRFHRVRVLILGLIGALALIAVPLTQTAQASANQRFENSVFDLTNKKRNKVDLVSLRGSKCVDSFAERHAKRMAEEQRMYHQQLKPIMEACKLSMAGENVAYGYPTGKATLLAWMDSPGHRANILNPSFTRLGIGIVRSENRGLMVSQEFAT